MRLDRTPPPPFLTTPHPHPKRASILDVYVFRREKGDDVTAAFARPHPRRSARILVESSTMFQPETCDVFVRYQFHRVSHDMCLHGRISCEAGPFHSSASCLNLLFRWVDDTLSRPILRYDTTPHTIVVGSTSVSSCLKFVDVCPYRSRFVLWVLCACVLLVLLLLSR